MTIHHLDEVLEAREIREAAAAELRKAAGGTDPVVEWLRSDEGEQWSRDRTMADPGPIVIMRPWWRARGPLPRRHDPCGRPPENLTAAKAGGRP